MARLSRLEAMTKTLVIALVAVLVGHAMAWSGNRKTFMGRLWSNMTDLAREGRFPAWE